MNKPDPWSLMEPAAKLSGDRWRRRPCDISTESERSIAISLKRIADNFDKFLYSRGISEYEYE